MRDLKVNDARKRFKAIIGTTPVEGKIQLENGKYYLCQNKRDGARCSDKLGYKFSWSVESGSVKHLLGNEVKNLKVKGWTEKEINECKDFQIGDELISHRSYNRVIVAKFGERLLLADTDDGKAVLLTAQELYDDDWRLNIEHEEDEPETVELSVAEVAEKLGIDAKTLKIVDNK